MGYFKNQEGNVNGGKIVFIPNENDEVDRVSLRMMEQNRIDGVIGVEEGQEEGRIVFRFDVGDKIPLCKVNLQKSNNKLAISILRDVASAMERISDYLIPEDLCVFQEDSIFLSPKSGAASVLLCPIIGYRDSCLKDMQTKESADDDNHSSEKESACREDFSDNKNNALHSFQSQADSSDSCCEQELSEDDSSVSVCKEPETFFSFARHIVEEIEGNALMRPILSQVREIITEDDRISYSEIANKLDMLCVNIDRMLAEELAQPGKVNLQREAEEAVVLRHAIDFHDSQSSPEGHAGLNEASKTLFDSNNVYPNESGSRSMQTGEGVVFLSRDRKNVTSNPFVPWGAEGMNGGNRSTSISSDEGMKMTRGHSDSDDSSEREGTSLLYEVQTKSDLVPEEGVSEGRDGTIILTDKMVMGSDQGGTVMLSEKMLYGQKARSPLEKEKVFLYRKRTGERHELDLNILKKGRLRIGKEKSTVDYFIMDNPAISRHHADIVTHDSEYYIVDTHSLNHTRINNRLLGSDIEYPLHDGDVVTLADEDFIFQIEREFH